MPFNGLRFVEPPEARLFTIVELAVPVVVLGVLAALELRRDPRRDVTAWFVLANAALLLFLTRYAYLDVIARHRLSTGLVIAAQLFCAHYRLRWLHMLLALLWLLPTLLVAFVPGGPLW